MQEVSIEGCSRNELSAELTAGISSSIVLFYSYFLPELFPALHSYPNYYEEKLHRYQTALCNALCLKGRVLLSREGINGTLSGTPGAVDKYISLMNEFELFSECGYPVENNTPQQECFRYSCFLFQGIDWKVSSSKRKLEPFPDLKISIVPEIVSTGGALGVEELSRYGGKHLTPVEFHRILETDPDVVVLDIRNTFEYEIGHFIHPATQTPAIQPSMTQFSSLDKFLSEKADDLKDKKVLMYCTGGIRCEKASAMLRKRGVDDVNQLKGGIHRYLEVMGEDGYFKGRNFVFDQRVSISPRECRGTVGSGPGSNSGVVGRCLECEAPFDEIDGSRVCTVCRDLVLVCNECQRKIPEYHCKKHAELKDCYFTFLDRFYPSDLQSHLGKLTSLRDKSGSQKNYRRTLTKQIDKVKDRLRAFEGQEPEAVVNANPPRRCRTCFDSFDLCDGRCWGFWRNFNPSVPSEEIKEISVGDRVKPGPHWNPLRLGDPSHLKEGVVVDRRASWSGSLELDFIEVAWCVDEGGESSYGGYRWGEVARNGQRLYDVVKI